MALLEVLIPPETVDKILRRVTARLKDLTRQGAIPEVGLAPPASGLQARDLADHRSCLLVLCQ